MTTIITLSDEEVNAMRNDEMVELLELFKPMLFNLSRAYEQDFDDACQDAAEFMLELWEKTECNEIAPYMRKAVKYHFLKRLPKKWQEVSIDASLSDEEDNFTLADTLEDDIEERRKVEDREIEVEQRLYQFLRRLPEGLQICVKQEYKLLGYTPKGNDHSGYTKKAVEVRKRLRKAMKENKEELLALYS